MQSRSPYPELIVAAASAAWGLFWIPLRAFALDAFPVTPGANATKVQKGKLRELAESLLRA